MASDVVTPPEFAALNEQFESLAAKVAELEARTESQAAELARIEGQLPKDQATVIAFSGDMDRLMAAFIVSNGAAVMGMDVTMFFTFWGLSALKKQTSYAGKSVAEVLVAMMLPGSAAELPTSRMNMMGLGPLFFSHIMKQKNVESLPDLVDLAVELDVKLVACQMSMGIMGITRDEMRDDIEYAGVAGYLDEALDAKLSLFF